MADSLRVVIYAAKSTPDERGSIPDQVKACRDYAAAQGWLVDGEPESDPNASAYSGNRGPNLERAMKRATALAERHGKAGLLVWHSNRLARGGGDAPGSAKHLAEYLFWAQRATVELHAVEDDFTFSNPILTVVMGEMAHQESKVKSANVRKGMARRRAAGKHTGGQVFGYVRHTDLGLTEDPATAPTVRRIFELVAGGKSQAEVARLLNREGVRPMRGAQWTQGSIAAMLRRRTYLGEIPADDWRSRTRRNIVEEWTAGAHEPIVSEELWKAANAARERAASVKGRRGGPRPNAGHLLPGRMLRHAACGSAMTPVSGDEKQDGTVSGWYVCSGQKSGVCDEGYRVGMADVDDAITGYLAEVGIDVEKSLRLVREAAKSHQEATASELDRARHEAATAEANVKRVRRDYMEGRITAEDWQSLRADLEGECAATTAKLARLEAKAKEAKAAPEVVVPAVSDALGIVRAAMQAGDTDAVREALEALFEYFVIGDAEDAEQIIPAVSPEEVAAARAQLREQVRELERKAGKTVAEAEAEYWAEEAALDLPEPPPEEVVSAERVVILPWPREDAFEAIVEDGEPVYLTDEAGRSMFRRVALTTNNDGLTT
jgi:DNA invertase Pin-like site-specific DNA recombinase